MKRNLVFLVISCVIALSLVLASCAPAAPTVPTTPTTPTVPTTPTIPVAPEEGKEMVQDSLGRMVEKPKYGGVINWVEDRAIRGWDPTAVMAFAARQQVHTYNSLIELDWTKSPTGTNQWSGRFGVEPITHKIGMLAESWEIPDEETLIVHIRKGVHFALDLKNEASRLVGGRELTAEDVVYTVTRMFAQPLSQYSSQFKPEERPVSLTATDKYTVVIKANAGYMDSVIQIVMDRAFYIPFEVVKKYGDMSDWRNAVGTGPFMPVDYVQGSSVTLVRNPNYWQKDPFHPQNQLPYVDGIKILWIGDTSTRLAGMRTNKFDHGIYTLSRDDAESLRATNPKMNFVEVLQSSQTIHLRMDNPELPWYDQKVRWALSMAIDREAIARDYYQGNAEILAAPVAPVPEYMAAYTPLEKLPESVRELYKYQPEKAKELLAEAGYPTGFKITVDTSLESDVDLLSVAAFYWQKIGVDLKIAVHEKSVFDSMMFNRTIMEAGQRFLSGTALYGFYNYTPEGPVAFNQILDPHNSKVQDIVKGNAVRNEAVTLAAWKEFNIYVLDKAWFIIFPAPYQYIAYQPWLKGYSGEFVTSGQSNHGGALRYLWYDQELKKQMTERK